MDGLWAFLMDVMSVQVARRASIEGGGPWRAGQTYMNMLYEVRPDLHAKVINTENDPFYLDERIPAFLAWLAIVWYKDGGAVHA